MEKIALVIEYVGTQYHGFQIQPQVPTIQGELEKAVVSVTGQFSRVYGAGRTDAGVHAKGQVVAFETDSILPPKDFVNALNFYLPDDIAVKGGYQVARSFDPRRDAKSREYQYTLYNCRTRSPFNREFSYQISRELDLEKMGRAVRMLEGEHDFALFTNNEGREQKTIRTVFNTQLDREGDFIRFNIVGNAFLPQQVRRIMGSLLKVGAGDMDIIRFQELIAAKNSVIEHYVAPAQGLCLININYT